MLSDLHVPLIEPDVRISRIRLSEKVHAFFGMQRRLQRLKFFSEVLDSSSLSLAPLLLPALTFQLRPLPSAVITRFVGTMGRSDSHRGLDRSSRTSSCGCRRRDGSPVLRRLPCKRAVATTPADPSQRIVRAFDGPLPATAAAFPHYPRGRRPQDLFRGLLSVHFSYGPSAC